MATGRHRGGDELVWRQGIPQNHEDNPAGKEVMDGRSVPDCRHLKRQRFFIIGPGSKER